ncbi:glycosyltransferase family 4 protein [Polynucleobacter difficilis]|uniref:glycosyltransferase family 4 protein n=1 Tax=Polynucleobacter difficilis TaxID=556054 RepID=UPI000D35A016|nr:glycosyltransferase family 4 protein [Polynucleobacter difficilis]
MAKILFVVNVDWFFVSHRLPLALSALEGGHEIHIACTLTDKAKYLKELGIRLHSLEFRRDSINPFALLAILCNMYSLFRRIKPDIVYLITIKPVLMGGIAAKLAKVPAVISAVPGLGFVFLNAKSFKQKLLRYLIILLYRQSFSHKNQKIIFQNCSDKDYLLSASKASSIKSVLIRGAGVSLEKFPYISLSESVGERPLIVAMASRLLKDKGVFEYVEAAKILKKRGNSADFWLIGAPDPSNPGSIEFSQVEVWRKEGFVECLGYRTEIAELYSKASIITLPSYGEGLPKSLIEAAACGRPVITTNVPGCRDAIIQDITGLLVPPGDAMALANAIEKLLLDERARIKMGDAGRKLAEKEFDVGAVIALHNKIYNELLRNS